MIKINNVKKFCKDNISMIENYEKAINDTTQTWICHHRLGIDLGLSSKQLKDKDLYFNRPASELIFLTRAEHISIHSSNRIFSEETRKRMSDAKQKGFVPWNKGLTKEIDERVAKYSNALKGRNFSEEARKRMSAAKQKGFVPWNKGKKVGALSEEHRQKISNSLKGRVSYVRTEENRKKQSESHKGQIAWNKGLPREEQPTFGKTWKLTFKRGWKINPETGKREYFRIE